MNQNFPQLKCVRTISFSSSLTANERLSNLSDESLETLITAIESKHSHLPKWISPSLLKQMKGSSISSENNFSNDKKISRIFMMRNSENGTEFLLCYEEDNPQFSYWVFEKDLLTNASFASNLEIFRQESFDFNSLNKYIGCSIEAVSHRLVEENIVYLFKVKTLSFMVYFWEPVKDMNESYAARSYNFYLRSIPQRLADIPTSLPQLEISSKSNSLLKFQVEGIQWIIDRWLKKDQCILGDEAGFGKTVQFLLFLEHINKHSDWHGPFIVIADTDQLSKWKQEIEKWTNLYSIIYDGDQDSCLILRDFGFPAVDKDGNVQDNFLSFNILLVSYDTYYRDQDKLQNYKWQIACLDNPTNILHSQLDFSFSFKGLDDSYKIILCDNLASFSNQQIICLLNFLQPSSTWNTSLFTKLYQERAKQLLESVILCRTKQVIKLENDMIKEYVAFVMPTSIQKIMLRLIQLNELSLICHPKNREEFDLIQNNILSQYTCNHPFLVEGAETYFSSKIITDKKSLFIGASAKFLALDRIITASLGKNIKIALFAKTKEFNSLVREILELDQANYIVIDEQMNGIDIQNLLEYFNSPDNTDFFIILSSINLNISGLSSVSIVVVLDYNMDSQLPIINSESLFPKNKMSTKFVFKLITFGTQEHEQFIQLSKERELWNSIIVKSENTTNDFNDNDIIEIFPPDQSTLIDPPIAFSSTNSSSSFNDIISEFKKVAQIIPSSSLNSIEIAYEKSQTFQQTMNDRDFLSFIISESDQSKTSRNKSNKTENKTENENNATFNESEVPNLIQFLKKYGYGSWDEISQKSDGHNPSQIFEFCAIVVILSFRSIQGSLIPTFPTLLNQLYMTVPDFSTELLFCSESRLWSSVFYSSHSFNRTLNQVRKWKDIIIKEALSLIEILEMRCIYQMWAMNFGNDYFVFSNLPPIKNKVIDHSLFNIFRDKLEINDNIDYSTDSRLYEIVRLMKYDLIIEQKFEIHQYFNWWCEKEFDEILRVFKDFGYSFADIREFHAKTGILSKNSQEIKRFALGVKGSISIGKNISPSVHQMHFAPESVQKLSNFTEWSTLKEQDILQIKFAEEFFKYLSFTIQHLDELCFDIPVNWNNRDMKKFLLLISQYGMTKFDNIFNDPSFALPKREIEGNIIPIFENISSFSLFISRNKDTFENCM